MQNASTAMRDGYIFGISQSYLINFEVFVGQMQSRLRWSNATHHSNTMPCPLLNKSLKSLKSLLLRLLPAMSTSAAGENSGDRRSWDPPFDPTKPSLPLSYPITDLETLASRSYLASFHLPFNRSSVPVAGGGGGMLPARRRILVCHDMQGGYRDDARPQGGANADAYAIWHWHLMDVFVYFSHYLVTLPPPCWTNAAHTHGVKVLGTFLTEWDEGKKICEEMLATKASAQMYAERLAELAATLGFDGWLINMEVHLDVQLIGNLKEFVDHLSKTMHSSVPGSLVIWYDAVTEDGELRWQNMLNEKNKPFFDLCDGIFVNYTWKENYPEDSAALAGDRRYDVYMGIDVFGRNTYGGGQWNTNVALDLLKKDDVSAAIFAPGWVYETKQGPDFQTAQNRWWGLVEQSWGVLQSYPKLLPFYSNFDQGHGYQVSVEGLRVADGPWNNISSQGFQPVLNYTADHSETSMQTFVNFRDAPYSGGASLTVTGSLQQDTIFSAQLFNGGLSLEDRPVHVLYSVKPQENSALGLSFDFSSTTDGRTSVLVAKDISSFSSADQQENRYDTFVQAEDMNVQITSDKEWVLYKAAVQSSSGYTLTGINVVCTLKNPRKTKSEKKESSSLENYRNESLPYNASVGHISVRTMEQNMNFPPAGAWFTEGQYVSWSESSNGSKLSLKISWKLKAPYGTPFMKYNIYVEKLSADSTAQISRSYLGVARVEAFYVSELDVSSEVTRLRFIIQVCGYDGSCQELEESPTFDLAVRLV